MILFLITTKGQRLVVGIFESTIDRNRESFRDPKSLENF
jgi:hypothetical protein